MRKITVLLLGLSFVPPADAAERSGWALWLSPQATFLTPSGGYRPIHEGRDWGLGFHATLSRAGSPIALRMDAATMGTASTFEDTAATFDEGTKVGYPIDTFVGNDEKWLTLGVQWSPRPDASGPYGFATAGAIWLRGSTSAAPGIVLPDAPVLPSSTNLCVMVGAGIRGLFGRRKTHAVNAEIQFLEGARTDYVGTPAAVSDLGHTTFPSERGNLAAWIVRVGYAYGIRWRRAGRE